MKIKHILSLLLALAVMFLPACSEEKGSKHTVKPDISDAEATTIDVEAEAKAIMNKYSLTAGSLFLSSSSVEGEYLDEDLIRSYYGDAVTMPDFGSVESYAVYIDETQPLEPSEFGIFKMKDGADIPVFKAYLRARIELKITLSVAYPTMNVEPLTTAVFTDKDGYVWYSVISESNKEIDDYLKGKLD